MRSIEAVSDSDLYTTFCYFIILLVQLMIGVLLMLACCVCTLHEFRLIICDGCCAAGDLCTVYKVEY